MNTWLITGCSSGLGRGIARAALEQEEQVAVTARQPGDPDRGGRVVVETALREDAPFRLLLGSDAVRMAEETLQNRLRELQAWAPVSGQADFPIHEQTMQN